MENAEEQVRDRKREVRICNVPLTAISQREAEAVFENIKLGTFQNGLI